MADRHLCPVPGCRERIVAGRAMCRAHWRAVPPAIQHMVLRSRRAARALRWRGNRVEFLMALDAYRQWCHGAVTSLLGDEEPTP